MATRAMGVKAWGSSAHWMRRATGFGLGVVGAVSLALSVAGAAEIPEIEWQRLPDGPDRALHTMIYDAANEMLWSFGGIEADPGSNQFHNTVYRLDLEDPGARWDRLAIGGLRPPPLAFHAAVYDPVRQRMIVHGGLIDRNGTSSQQPADGNTLWFLDIADPASPTWSRASVPGGITDRFAQGAVYVPGVDAMIVSGGLSTFDNPRNDNYALLLGEEPMRWQRLANAGFNYRAAHALMYDPDGQRLLAYGGLTDFGNVNTLSDIVSLDLSEGLDGADRWLRLNTSSPALKRAFMASAYDPERELWWIHGGVVDNNRFLRDLSVLDLSQEEPEWIRTQVVYNGPLERFGHPGVWDAPRGRMIVQGGTPDNQVTLKDTRALNYLVVDTATPTASATTDAPTTTPTNTSPPTATATTDEPTASPTATTEAPTATATATETTAAPTPTSTYAAAPGVYLPVTMNRHPAALPTATTPTEPTATPPIAPTPTTQAPSAEIVGQLGGEMHAVAVQGDLAYVGMGPRMLILDVSDPAEPSVLWQSDVLPGPVRTIALDGSRAYVGSNFLTIFDVSDPLQPDTLAARVNVGGPRDIVVDGGFAFVGSGNGLRVIDVSDPTAPSQVGFLSSSITYSVAKSGDRVYMGGFNRFTVADASDPANPTEVGRFDQTSSVYGLATQGDTAYLGTFGDGLRTLDVSDPTSPTELSVHPTADSVNDVALSDDGSLAYLAVANGELVFVDVSDPASPTELGVFAPGGDDAYDVAVDAGRAYMVSGIGGLNIADVSDPADPDSLGSFFSPGRGVDIVADGGSAYIGYIGAGAGIVDVSNPAVPSETAFVGTLADASGVDVADGRMYVVDGFNDNLHVFDVTDPAAPQALGQASDVGAGQRVTVVGDRAYVAEFAGGLWVGDVSDPAAPARLGDADGAGRGRGVDVAGAHAYIASDTEGLGVFSIVDPANPVAVGRTGLPADANDVAVDGATAVVVGRDPHLQLFSVSDPANPVALGALEGSRTANAVVLQGDWAYVAHGFGLWIVDVSDPANPAEIADFRLDASYDGLAVAGDQVYLVGANGLVVVRVTIP